MHTLNLASAVWEFRAATERTRWRSAVVPGCVHRDLRRHGLIPDPFWGTNELELKWIEERDWEYRATFSVPAALLAEEEVELAADGLDTLATVTLNGHRVAATENMFVGHRWPVKRLLQAGRNELLFHFGSAMRFVRTHRREHRPDEFNDPIGRSSVLRKQACQFGWDWGPRFITVGVWRELRLEGWSENRLTGVRISQEHKRGEVILTIEPEMARNGDRGRDGRPARPSPTGGSDGITHRASLYLGSRTIATDVGPGGRTLRIKEPQLWWPNGHGAQPIYTVEIEAGGPGGVLGVHRQPTGLRTLALDRHPDRWGESFQFVVNGRPLFAKGANWIPAHSFVAGLGREDYAQPLRSAAQANMNMLRIWGGGVYESEHFYDLCDELGLLVWQDFMFACTMYPGDKAFLASVRTEAEHQVRRLRGRSCVALWCGNNEIAQLNETRLKGGRERRAYEDVFHRVLPEVVSALDDTRSYWPSSAWRGDGRDFSHAGGERCGDTHYWDVWHARHPVKDYEKWRFRFVSEFGMQSYSSPETQRTFCPPGDANVFGATMENHQKNRAGNQIILDYVSRRYRLAKDQDALIYLSQLNQAHCMQTGVEHYRRNMPRCMGALYWQLNDCWPVASWSSLEFTGRWKALHHLARRFYAPALVSAEVPGDETATLGNYRQTTVRRAHLYTVYDAPEPAAGRLTWELCTLDGKVRLSGAKAVALRYGRSVRQRTLDLAAPMEKFGRDRLYLRLALAIGGRVASEETVFLSPPRFLDLPRGRTAAAVRLLAPNRARLTFASPVFQHRFRFELPGLPVAWVSDNFFELYPRRKKTVTVEFTKPVTRAAVGRALKFMSLVDSYHP